MISNAPLPRTHSPRLELAWGLLLLAAGIGARLVFLAVFPTVPLSDFRGIIDFALDLRDKSLFVPGYYWDVFNLGPPLVLSVILRVFPSDPESTARIATAVWCGLMPLFPYLLWRGLLPLWVRVTTGALLALWPGQIFFSGVVAQDNWVLVPAVALGCLAVRALVHPDRQPPGYPVAAGLLYALCVTMRQEMLGALFPLLVAAGGFTRLAGWRPARVAACALAVGLPFLALCAQREKATGHFALSSGHAGFTLLGTVVPGATAIYWKDPVSYIASVEPELVRDRHRMFAEAGRLGMAEVRRRPGFQALRVASMMTRFAFASDPELLYWSLVAPGTLPGPLQARGQDFGYRAMPLLKLEMLAIQIAFLTALGVGLARRSPAILFLAAAVLLKFGLHTVLVSQARFFVPATGLELVTVGVGLWEIARARGSRVPAMALLGGTLLAVGMAAAAPTLYSRLRSLDPDDEQRTYRFTLTSYETPGALDCVVRHGRLTALGDTEATLETLQTRPAAGERATAECTLRQPAGGPLAVEVLDSYEPGGQPGRMFQRVEIDGREILRHDVAAAPGTGWLAAPAGEGSGGAGKRVVIEVAAGAPDPTMDWGPAAAARFRIGVLKP